MDYNFIYVDLAKKNVEDLTIQEISEMKDFILTLTKRTNTSYNEILKRMLDSVPQGIDTRVGSIIYDSLAPSAGELMQKYIELQIWKDETYLLTAIGPDLDRKGEEYGIYRYKKTQAKRLGNFTDINGNLVNVPIGSRFTVPESNNTIIYYVKEYQSTGVPVLICEQYGTIGNEYSGAILPLFAIDSLKTATITGTLQPAQDDEEDNPYRERIITRINDKGFGGNIADYKKYILDIAGTSEPKIYPVWSGGGTVKCSILDSEFNPISEEFKQEIKSIIDPIEDEGKGIGIAPIGHVVTIDTPEKLTINITAKVTLEGISVGQIQKQVEEYIEQYFLETRKTWVEYDTIRIFTSQIISNILKVKGVQNVTNVRLNQQTQDIEITSTAEKQYIPILGTVVLSE